MEFDAAPIAHMGISSLWIILGLAIMIVGRKAWHVWAFGAILTIMGLQYLSHNLAARFEWEAYLLRGIQMVVTMAAGVASAFVLPRFLGVSAWRPAAYALALGALNHSLRMPATDLEPLLILLGFRGAPVELHPFLLLVGGSIGFTAVIMTASISAAAAFYPPTEPRLWRVAAALSCVFGIWVTVRLSSLSYRPLHPLSFASALLLVVGFTVPWLVAAWRSDEPLAARMGLLWPAVGFLSFLYVLVPGAAQGHDPWRMHDLGRVLGWGILVFAIAKYDLLGLPWPQSAVRRAAVAGGALAVLFGVARVAQNFVSAESGLLLGVVFTVVFIFAVGRFKQAGQGKGKTNRAA